jgi:hypothetical protein
LLWLPLILLLLWLLGELLPRGCAAGTSVAPVGGGSPRPIGSGPSGSGASRSPDEGAVPPSAGSRESPTRKTVVIGEEAPPAAGASPGVAPADWPLKTAKPVTAVAATPPGTGTVQPRSPLAEFPTVGDVLLTLRWHNANDLDLHVTDPAGEEIAFTHNTVRSGGVLDRDMNSDAPFAQEAIEHVTWPVGSAPMGKYVIWVVHYANHGAPDPTGFELEIKAGNTDRVLSGSLSPKQSSKRWTLELSPPVEIGEEPGP